jgi:hypothetical protein
MVEVSPEAAKPRLVGSLRRRLVELPVTVGGASKVGLTGGPDFEVKV